jgi:hypothetical protein
MNINDGDNDDNSADNDDNAYNSTNFFPSINTHDDGNSRELFKLDVNDNDDNNDIITDSVMVNLINVGNETIILATSSTTTTTTTSTTTSAATSLSTVTAVSKMNLFNPTGKRPLSHENRRISRGRILNSAPIKEKSLSSRPLSSPSSSSSQMLEKKDITSKV